MKSSKTIVCIGTDRLLFEAASTITNPDVAVEYIDELIEPAISREAGQNLYRYTPDWFKQHEHHDPRIYTARMIQPDGSVSQVIAGIHTVMIDGLVELRGAVITEAARGKGISVNLTAWAVLDSIARYGRQITFECQIRVYPDGRENDPAKRMFLKIGLKACEIVRFELSPIPLMLHLYITREPDGCSFRSRILRGAIAVIEPAASLILSSTRRMVLVATRV